MNVGEEIQTTTQVEEKPMWIQTTEYLLMTLETYRIKKETVLKNLTEILEAHEVDLSVDVLQQLPPEEIPQKLSQYEEKARGGR